MAINVEVITSLVGPSHMLTESDVANWLDIIDLVTVEPCDFEIRYNGSVFTGSIAKTDDELTLLVGFDDSDIALPGGMCLIVNCVIEGPGEDGCYPNAIIGLTLSSKLMAVDEDGCPIGYIELSELISFIESQLNIPQTLCDLIGVGGIPEGNLVAADRILTTTGDPACSLKSVPQSDVVCE